MYEQSSETTVNSHEDEGQKSQAAQRAEEMASGVIQKASDAVAKAEAELKKAKQFYDDVCQQASDRYQAAREKKVGELIDGVLESVKKRPGLGVALAAAAGFMLGRIFHRR